MGKERKRKRGKEKEKEKEREERRRGRVLFYSESYTTKRNYHPLACLILHKRSTLSECSITSLCQQQASILTQNPMNCLLWSNESALLSAAIDHNKFIASIVDAWKTERTRQAATRAWKGDSKRVEKTNSEDGRKTDAGVNDCKENGFSCLDVKCDSFGSDAS